MMDVDNIVHHNCRDHPRYQLKRKPTGGCEACWDAWLRKQKYLRKLAEDQARDEHNDRWSR